MKLLVINCIADDEGGSTASWQSFGREQDIPFGRSPSDASVGILPGVSQESASVLYVLDAYFM